MISGLPKVGGGRKIPEELTRQGVARLEVTSAHCREAARLPLRHRDPFDRMPVTQAVVEECALLSIDPQLDFYDVQRIW